MSEDGKITAGMDDRYIPIRLSDFAAYFDGLWDKDFLADFMIAILDYARTGERPKQEDYKETMASRYMYLFICQTLDRIDSSWKKYDQLSAKRAAYGRKGGLSSAKARAEKIAAGFEYQEDHLEELKQTEAKASNFQAKASKIQAKASNNKAIACQNEAKASKNEAKASKIQAKLENFQANQAMTKTKTTLAKRALDAGPLLQEGSFKINGALPDRTALPPEAGAPSASAAVTLEEVQRIAITGKVNLSREGLLAWYEKMQADGWEINGSRVTRKTMLRALRGFAKNFPQWQRSEPDADQAPDRESIEDLEREYLEAWEEM